MISKNLKKRIITSLLLLSLFILIYVFNEILIFSLIIFGVVSILEFIGITRKIFNHFLVLIISNSIFVIYVFMFCIITVYFSNILPLKIIFSLLLSCITSDVEICICKTFKGPKLQKFLQTRQYLVNWSLILSCLTFSFQYIFYKFI